MRQLLQQLGRKKSISQFIFGVTNKKKQLHRSIGLPSVIAIGLGCIIGTGIFVLTGKVALQHSGSGIMLAFVFSGFACLLAALCYAEFASSVPIAGSAYAYSYVTMGEFVAWLIGWDLILEYGFAIITVASGWSSHIVSILVTLSGDTLMIPEEWVTTPFDPILAKNETDGSIARTANGEPIVAGYGIANIPAMVIILLLSTLLFSGVKSSLRFNNIMVVIKISIALFFVGVGFFFVNPENWSPLIPDFIPSTVDAHTGSSNLPLWQVIATQFGYSFSTGFGGWSGVFTGAAILFYAYLGFDAITTTAEEAKNPHRNLPLGIIWCIGICTILYILMAAVFTGLVKTDGSVLYEELGIYRGAPLAYAFLQVPVLNRFALLLIELGGFIGITSVLLVLLFAQSRIVFAISRDGLLPAIFSKIDKEKKIPSWSILLFGIVLSLISGFVPLYRVAELVNIGTLSAFFLVSLAILYLRKQKHQNPYPVFRVPWFPYLPFLSMLICLALMMSLPTITWLRFFIWMAVGVVIYFIYGIKKSKLEKK